MLVLPKGGRGKRDSLKKKQYESEALAMVIGTWYLCTNQSYAGT